MALVRVKEKGAGADAPATYVDEAWLERWPDDFELAPEAAAPAEGAQAPAQAPESDTAQRRRSADF
jgi:hypothetical protein